MFAVKDLMLESLLNFRFRGTTLDYEELLIALENIIIDKVATVLAARNRKIDTSALMESATVAAKEDCDSLRRRGPANR